jgi:hypothetical protein
MMARFLILHALIEDILGAGFATHTTSENLDPIGAPRVTFELMPSVAFVQVFLKMVIRYQAGSEYTREVPRLDSGQQHQT